MSGYIGNIPVPQATQTRQSFTATASQTTFNTAGYSPGYIDVFLNGVKLAPADYTATNGSDVVLAVGAASGDILETVAYEIFQVLDQDFTGDFTVDTDTFVVDSVNDRVGVGTASPEKLLDVDGGAIIRGRLTLGDTTEYAGGTLYQSGGNTILRAGSTADSITLYNSGSSVTYAQFAPTYSYFSQNVGIGTSSPMVALNVHDSTNARIALTNSSTGQTFPDGFELLATGLDAYVQNRSNGNMVFTTNNTEAARIDASGNLLVGKTASSIANDGFQAHNSGYIGSTNSGASTAYFNRKTNDGDIVNFQKDSTTVGSIGNRDSNDLYINTAGGTGSLSIAGTETYSWSNNYFYSRTDNARDLGTSSSRWQNLYLSGGVYLGGTGSANKLDDYEEGTWTPVTSSGTISNAAGSYTKVGRLVTLIFRWSSITGGSGQVSISGLPFAKQTGAGFDPASGGCMFDGVSTTRGITPYIGGSNINFYGTASGNANTWWYLNHSDGTGTDPLECYGSIWYYTNS